MKTIKSLSKISGQSKIYLNNTPQQAGSYAFDYQLNVPLSHTDGDTSGPVRIEASLKALSRRNNQPQGGGEVCFEMSVSYQAIFQEGQSIESSDDKQAVYDAIWPYVYDDIIYTMRQYPVPPIPPVYRISLE